MTEQILDISWETITKVFIAGFVFYILFLARNVIIWFFFALIVSLMLDEPVNFLRRLRIPKIVSVILVYLAIFGLLGLIIYFTAPIFIYEFNQLLKNIPAYFENINPILKGLGINLANNFEDLTANLVASLQDSSSGIVRAVAVFFGGISSTFVIFTLAFFISLEEKGVEKVLALLVPKKYEKHVVVIFEKAQLKVSGWFGARILACIFVGAASFIVFFLLGIKYAFILALLSGVLNFVPYVGPTITLIVSILFVGASTSWIVALYVLIALLVIQEIENKMLTPILMKKFIDLPPVLVLLALLVGGILFGFLGMIFVVPVSGIIYEFVKEFFEGRKQSENLSMPGEQY